MGEIELTFAEKKAIRDTVRTHCANCQGNYCLPEDAECYMTTIAYRDSALCMYFRESVLPTVPAMVDIFCRDPTNVKMCALCGARFQAVKNKQYCSDRCALRAAKKRQAARQKKWREKQHTK